MGTLSTPALLLSLGADAMDNMFDIFIFQPAGFAEGFASEKDRTDTFLGESLDRLALRADGFDPPTSKIKTYKVAYKAVEMDRPATKIEMTREFKITFRTDAYYQAYRFLSTWKSMIHQAASGYATNALWSDKSDDPSKVAAINKLTGTVIVRALNKPISMAADDPYRAPGVTDRIKESAKDVLTWEFYDVWIADLEEPKYKTGGGDAIKVAATFKFADYKDPIYAAHGKFK